MEAAVSCRPMMTTIFSFDEVLRERMEDLGLAFFVGFAIARRNVMGAELGRSSIGRSVKFWSRDLTPRVLSW
jgi:hypothetical protein